MAEQNTALREIDKPFYSYWQALYHSFFNPKLYVDVGKRWKGFGILYLLLLMFIVTIPFSVRVAQDFNRFFMRDVVQPLAALPTLYIQNGTVSFDKPMPYFIKSDTNQIVAIVDTTGKVTSIDNRYPDLNILITKDKLYYRFPTPKLFYSSAAVQTPVNSIYVYPFSKESNSVFDGKEWIKSSGIVNLKLFFGLLIYPTVALTCFAVFLIILVVFAMMGQLIAKLMKFSLRYPQACRLLMVSTTPFMIVLWIALTMNWPIESYGFFMPLIFIAYYCFAILSLKKGSQKLVVS